jgi:hypothetical protein
MRQLVWGAVYTMEPHYLSVALPEPSFQLRHHASLLHLTDSSAAAALDQRQMLTQAIRCYEEAVKIAQPGSAPSLAALLDLHSALRQRAESSEYFMDRAVEKGDVAYAMALHDRIHAEHPNNAAARQTVWWTFRPTRTFKEWRPGWNAMFQREVELAVLLGARGDVNYWERDWAMDSAIKTLTTRLQETFAAERDPTKLRSEIVSLRNTAKREVPSSKAARLLNHLDDLELMLATPNLDAATITAYFTARMEGKPVDVSHPQLLPIKDFATFWNHVITPSIVTDPIVADRQHIAQAQVSRMTAFLQEFPKSVKREAALARLAINTLRQSRSHCGMVSSGFDLDDPTNYAAFRIDRGMPFDAPAIFAALDAYDREFPKGRYHWDILLMRAIASSEAQDFPTALKLFITILNAPDHRDLHLDASNNLCGIFMDLLNPEQRLKIVAAIKATPGAWDKLNLFMNSQTCGWRLLILEDWLLAQH